MLKRSSFKIFLTLQNFLFLRELNIYFSFGRMGIFLAFIFIAIVLLGRSSDDFDFTVFSSFKL